MCDVSVKIAHAVLRKPQNSFITALKSTTTFAETIRQDFRLIIDKFHILSFYETRPLGRLGIVSIVTDYDILS